MQAGNTWCLVAAEEELNLNMLFQSKYKFVSHSSIR